MRKPSPFTLKIVYALEDGEWHKQEDVIDAVQYTIPPGEAFRISEGRSSANATTQEMIEAGRRRKSTQTINSLISNGRVERRGRGGDAELKLLDGGSSVFVVRTRDGRLIVDQYRATNQVTVYVLDEQSEEDQRDMANLIEEALPPRMARQSEILDVCARIQSKPVAHTDWDEYKNQRNLSSEGDKESQPSYALRGDSE